MLEGKLLDVREKMRSVGELEAELAGGIPQLQSRAAAEMGSQA